MTGRWTAEVYALVCWVVLPSVGLAQIRVGAELRGRVEFNSDPGQDRDERLYLNRLRFTVAVEPARWVTFHFQGEDVRPFSFHAGASMEGHRNSLDMRQGYVALGRAEEGWQLRLGRQELAVGDERLLGAVNDWDCFGQTFDAVRISLGRKRSRVEAFTGFRTQPARRRPDPFDTASRISGLTVQFGGGAAGWVIEPYVLWKRGGETLDLDQRPGHRDVVTPGLRTQGRLPRNLDYNAEIAIQRGHVVGDRIAAWAGHSEIGWKPLGQDMGPRLGFEYNFASGDKDPEDGRHNTFDDLYPAGFNKYGITDLYAWRNIRYPAAGVDVPVTRRWTLYGGGRSYWLASVRDGLYPGGDEFLLRNPSATSSHVGSQIFFSAGYVRSEHWKFFGGYGRLWPGSYLRQSGYTSALRTVYVLSSVTF